EFGEITVWPPRKQRPVRICFIFSSSQINRQFSRDPCGFVLPLCLFCSSPRTPTSPAPPSPLNGLSGQPHSPLSAPQSSGSSLL
ncbi:hypothetical protein H8957_017557, partial [Semnopithecus entellus]